MRYVTKVQGIQRADSQQLYVTVPQSLVQRLGWTKGQAVAWVLGPDSQLILQGPHPPAAPPSSQVSARLLTSLEKLLRSCQGAFATAEQFDRSVRHLLSQLVCLGRHTITGLLCSQNRQDRDWTADYRHYAQGQAQPEAFFEVSRQEVQAHLAPGEPLVIALDDSLLRKSGRKTCGVSYLRDPLSPPFHTNLVRGARLVQLSAAWTYGQGQARMIPVDFCLAPLPAKPGRQADPQAQAAYQQQRTQANINLVARQRCQQFYERRRQAEAGRHPLILSVDGRLTNHTFLHDLPAGLTVIGRIRKDAALFYLPPPPQPQERSPTQRRSKTKGPPKPKGRKRRYGAQAPTPEALRQDDTVRWTKVKVHFAGRQLTFRCKRLRPVLSRLNQGQHPLQVVVVAPVHYRAPSGKEICREPAYLLCTDPRLSLRRLLQYYFWRWDIEVNFRDEKTLLGVGQAQVRRPRSTEQAPALAVAGYSLLLVAALKTYGPEGQPAAIPWPKWRRRKLPRRATTNRLINQLRFELWAAAIERSNFSDFIHPTASEQKPEKLTPDLCSSLFHANR